MQLRLTEFEDVSDYSQSYHREEAQKIWNIHPFDAIQAERTIHKHKENGKSDKLRIADPR